MTLERLGLPREARRGRRGGRGRLPGRAASVAGGARPRHREALRRTVSSCSAGTSRSTSGRSSRTGDLAAEIGAVRGADRPLADAGDGRGPRGRRAAPVVARAGIGLDNVDVEAATRRGVMVVNAPQSNVISAAEHTLALLLAQARNIPQAHAALTRGPVGARRVGGRGARRQDDRRDRPRPRRRAGRASCRGVRHAGDRVRPVRVVGPREGDGRRRDAHARGAAGPGGLRHDPPAAHGRDRGTDRRARAVADEAGRASGEHRARRHRRRGRAGEGARGRPAGRRGARRVRRRADHRQPDLRVRARGRDAAPGRVDARGAGQGRDHGRRDGPAGAPRRVRPVRRERVGGSGGLRDRPAVRAARGAARRAARRARRGRRARRSSARTWGGSPRPTRACSRSRS